MRRSYRVLLRVGLRAGPPCCRPRRRCRRMPGRPTPRRCRPTRTPASRLTALDTAGRVLAGDALPTDPSATVALRDLWVARPDLTRLRGPRGDAPARPAHRRRRRPVRQRLHRAVRRASAARTCASTTCRPPRTLRRALDWVALNLTTMENVYEREVNQLGFRAPRGDGSKGGDGKLDVYLKDLGTGLYGYCAAEFRKKARTASGFCVLDNDYAAGPVPQPDSRGQPRGDRGARVLPRRAVLLRLQRGPVDARVHGHLDGGAGRRRRQRQPAVPPVQPAPGAVRLRSTRSARPTASSTATGSSGSTSPRATAPAS